MAKAKSKTVGLKDYIAQNQSRMTPEELAKSIGQRRLKPIHFVDGRTKVEVDEDWNLINNESTNDEEPTVETSTNGNEKDGF